jgi:uncharacterized protein YydD (DUF2326 family)
MIYEITSSLPRFKTLELGPGLNIVLADRTEASGKTDTRNGSGKSSIVEIIHFLLGAKAGPNSMFRQPPLDEHWFQMTFDLGGAPVTVRRSGATASKVSITPSSTETSVATLFDGFGMQDVEQVITNEEWKRRLAPIVFGIMPEGDWPPSFRSCISYFLRLQSAGGFQTPTKHFSQQATWDVQVNLSLLLGLDVELPRAWQRLREREKQLEALRRAGYDGTAGMAGSAAELASELAGATDELTSLRDSVTNFTVIPTYSTVETEVTQLGQRIRDLNNQIISDRDYLAQLERSLDEVHLEPATGLMDLYAAANVQLPDTALAAFDDVQAFHNSVVSNRRQYLAAEIQRVTNGLNAATDERDSLARRRSDGLRLLSTGGAIETLVELQRDLVQRQVRVERLRERYEVAIAMESQRGELKIERQRLAATLARDLAERQKALAPAFVIFERLSQRLYSDEQHGRLIIAATENGPEISATIPRGRSQGITNMQVYCFDMDIATLWSRRGQGPGFLFHDSHLFDGVDERQRDAALQYGAEYAKAEGFQYVVTLNSDEIPEQLPSGELLAPYILPQRLTDYGEDGGLFGLRF